MIATTIVSAVCTAGIAFYLRFIVALCQEYKPGLRGHWLFLRQGTGNGEVVELQRRERPTTRVA